MLRNVCIAMVCAVLAGVLTSRDVPAAFSEFPDESVLLSYSWLFTPSLTAASSISVHGTILMAGSLSFTMLHGAELAQDAYIVWLTCVYTLNRVFANYNSLSAIA